MRRPATILGGILLFASSALAVQPFSLQWMNHSIPGRIYQSADYPRGIFVLTAFENVSRFSHDNASHVDELAAAYAGQPRVQVIDLGLDSDDAEFDAWIGEHHPNHPVLKDDYPWLHLQLEVRQVPTVVVLDHHGTVLYKHVGVWDATVTHALHSVIDGLLAPTAGIEQADPLLSHFECKAQSGGSYRPYYLQAINNGTAYKDYSQTAKGLLGQNAMTSLDECKQALAVANNEFGVICSRTGLDGWKPTIYTGTVPGRADFGYLGGSSIMEFSDCLKATKNSSKDGVCFWGGSDWYVSPIDHEGIAAGPFNSVDDCVSHTKG